MKSKSFISEKNNGFKGQFKELSDNEMINLKGGTVPPDPKPGDDYPIDPLK
jgi:hypothetical protein